MDKKTLFITSQTNDPAFNLAAEEVLLRKHNTNIIYLYINKPSVIVGKHQNTLSEINLKFLEENDIPVYRRLSGGGTVFHDYGNINYCIIENGEPGKLVDFVRATTPVVEALKDYGVDARHGKRNDLLAGYRKISGNACHVYKSRAMHHGTLLFNSDLNQLTASLKADATKFKDKSVKSVRSEVVNIKELVPGDDTNDFLEKIGTFLKQKFRAVPYQYTSDDLAEIEKLMDTKYNKWEWNYGYSPVYEFSKRVKMKEYIYHAKLKVEKGTITEIEIKTNHADNNLTRKLTVTLRGLKHEKKEIKKALENVNHDIHEGIMACLF